ncbi:hypothetical protein ON010_g17894 [Phytophthora cinnamomi]|nr:hypothetical protein ON010_g17894 [Phytophthora cinnamomi]
MYGGAANGSSNANVSEIEGSAASYRDVFANSSMPSLLAKLDGTIVEANALFLELCCKNIDELRLHSLYTMCTAMDAPKMYTLVSKILSCEMASAQSKMMWHFSSTGDRKVRGGSPDPSGSKRAGTGEQPSALPQVVPGQLGALPMMHGKRAVDTMWTSVTQEDIDRAAIEFFSARGAAAELYTLLMYWQRSTGSAGER